ncbi:unnamed protein product [Ilex paraguariensis]|uniref:Uncharacterized protein n=1 Tax=Ilex paraguariensis TaxID=185542 RepID=A0ABC8UX40_9AQUA
MPCQLHPDAKHSMQNNQIPMSHQTAAVEIAKVVTVHRVAIQDIVAATIVLMAASRIGNDCARNELFQIITKACTGNNSDHNSDDPIGTGSGKCSSIVERCRSLGYAYHYSPGPDGKPKYQIQFSPECCNTVSQVTDDCSSDKSVRTIIESCNPKGGNHSGGNDHDGGNNHNDGNSTKGFLGNNGSAQCSPIVRKCMYKSSYFSYHFKSGTDGVKHYVYEFAPDCCSEALQITGDCAHDADVTIITDQCKSESG